MPIERARPRVAAAKLQATSRVSRIVFLAIADAEPTVGPLAYTALTGADTPSVSMA
jgi:hypothetical protein